MEQENSNLILVFYSISPIDVETNGAIWQKGSSIKITLPSLIRAYSIDSNGNKSNIIEGKFIKVSNDKKIDIKSKFSNQYNAGGPDGLIDGIRGEKNFRLGGWQGYQGQDFEAIVDLGSLKPVKSIVAGFLQDAGPWIWLPKQVEFSISEDGENFTTISTLKHEIPDTELKSLTKEFVAKVDVRARFIKVIAKKYGTIPEWHQGAGEQAWIFIDEIIVE